MKITIATLSNVRPDFIQLQHESIKRFVADADIEYIVFNNASENKERFEEIENICKKLHIKSIVVKKRNIIFKWIKENVSRLVARSLNYIWKNYLQNQHGIVVIIDSDMFFVKKISIEKLMEGHDMCFVPSYHGEKFDVLYPWTGLMFFKMDTLPDPSSLRWNTGSIDGYKVDVGGLNHYYMQKHKAYLSTLYIEMWNLEDIKRQPNGTAAISCNINGTLRLIITLDKSNHVMDVKTKDAFISEKKSFPYQKERDDYYQHIADNFLRFESWLSEKGAMLPHPFWIDMFRVQGKPFDESFVFHYKSGGNWLPFYTEEYNNQKTKGLHKLIS